MTLGKVGAKKKLHLVETPNWSPIARLSQNFFCPQNPSMNDIYKGTKSVIPPQACDGRH